MGLLFSLLFRYRYVSYKIDTFLVAFLGSGSLGSEAVKGVKISVDVVAVEMALHGAGSQTSVC